MLPTTYRTDQGLTVEGASPELLAELLDAYEYEIKRRSPDAWVSAKPGLSADEIVGQMTAAGLSVPEEAVVWWSWANGHRLDATWRIRHPQISLETALEYYDQDARYNFEHLPGPLWIRVAGPQRNSAVGIDCASTDGPPIVRWIDPELGTGPARLSDRQAVSLCTPVTWWLMAIENGWWKYDKSGFWRVPDLHAYPAEWRLMNLL